MAHMTKFDPDRLIDRAEAGVPAQAHPSICHLYAYWESIRGGGGIPILGDFDTRAISDLLPDLWMLDVQLQPLRLRYRFMGKRIAALAGGCLIGKWLDDVHPHLGDRRAALARCEHVVQSGQPSWRRGEPLLMNHGDYEEIENVLLPFGSDNHFAVDVLVALAVLTPIGRTSD